MIIEELEGDVRVDNDWNGLADLIANLITKYAGVLDLDNLPDPMPVNNNSENENIFDMVKTQIEKMK
ncbi:TPA: hypothetical protein ACJ510_001391 [Streptococcus equi subsp. zooepidemicus]